MMASMRWISAALLVVGLAADVNIEVYQGQGCTGDFYQTYLKEDLNVDLWCAEEDSAGYSDAARSVMIPSGTVVALYSSCYAGDEWETNPGFIGFRGEQEPQTGYHVTAPICVDMAQIGASSMRLADSSDPWKTVCSHYARQTSHQCGGIATAMDVGAYCHSGCEEAVYSLERLRDDCAAYNIASALDTMAPPVEVENHCEVVEEENRRDRPGCGTEELFSEESSSDEESDDDHNDRRGNRHRRHVGKHRYLHQRRGKHGIHGTHRQQQHESKQKQQQQQQQQQHQPHQQEPWQGGGDIIDENDDVCLTYDAYMRFLFNELETDCGYGNRQTTKVHHALFGASAAFLLLAALLMCSHQRNKQSSMGTAESHVVVLSPDMVRLGSFTMRADGAVAKPCLVIPVAMGTEQPSTAHAV